MDKGVLQATVGGVAKSQTTKQLAHALYPELSEQGPLLVSPTVWRQARF